MNYSLIAIAGAAVFLTAASPVPDAVDRACAGDMHLSRDSLDYKSCVANLTRAQADARRQRMLQQARANCSAAGLTPGSRDFAQCTLSNLPNGPETHLTQEQRGCAGIGVAPGDAAYPQCVANLDAALFGIDKIPTGE